MEHGGFELHRVFVSSGFLRGVWVFSSVVEDFAYMVFLWSLFSCIFVLWKYLMRKTLMLTLIFLCVHLCRFISPWVLFLPLQCH